MDKQANRDQERLLELATSYGLDETLYRLAARMYAQGYFDALQDAQTRKPQPQPVTVAEAQERMAALDQGLGDLTKMLRARQQANAENQRADALSRLAQAQTSNERSKLSNDLAQLYKADPQRLALDYLKAAGYDDATIKARFSRVAPGLKSEED